MALITHTTPIPEGSTARLTLVIADENDNPMDDTLTTLRLTYYDKATEEIINSRNDQNVLNTNNVTFGAQSLGAVTCAFIASSKIIRRTSGNWLYTDIQVGSQVTISGTVSNNNTFTVSRITVTDLTVTETLTDEAAVSATLSLSGKIIWSMQDEDTVMVDSRKETEDHIALFVWTWDSGSKTGSQEIQITIENLSLHP